MDEITTPSMFGEDTIQPVGEPEAPTGIGGLFGGAPEQTVEAPAPKRGSATGPNTPNPAMVPGLFPVPCPNLTTEGGFNFTTE